MGTSQSGNQTTRTEPPAYQLPYLQQGLSYAQSLFNDGGPQQYQGNTVTPFAPQTEQALSGIEQRATNGSPVIGAAQDYTTKSLNGDFLGQGNPWLDATYKKAADQSYNTLTSQFARSGRNVNAAAPVQGDILSGLASQIYGGAYENERDRQQGVLPYATPLAEADYRDLSALRGVGSEVEGLSDRIIQDQTGRWDYEQNRPEQNLNNYQARVSGNMGQTQSSPLYRNRGAGALGGAMSGAMTGAQLGSIVPGWGTGAGAIIGGIGGGLLGGWG